MECMGFWEKSLGSGRVGTNDRLSGGPFVRSLTIQWGGVISVLMCVSD